MGNNILDGRFALCSLGDGGHELFFTPLGNTGVAVGRQMRLLVLLCILCDLPQLLPPCARWDTLK